MLIVIGESDRGKSTISRQLAEGRIVISAGGWVRASFEGDPNDVEGMSVFSAQRLRADVNVTLNHVYGAMTAAGVTRDACVVEGIRNPRDLLMLVRPGDHVLDLGGDGLSPFERQGLSAIRGCRAFLATQLDVTWTDYSRNFATLPEPLDVLVLSRVLFGDDREGLTRGRLIALESYPGLPVTACWRSEQGGTFHDVPLEALRLPRSEGAPEAPLDEAAGVYSCAGIGSPVIEVSTLLGAVSVFDRVRRYVGTGRVQYMLHWPADNVLLHLLLFGDRVYLWPPHKLLGDVSARELPEWRKKK
jgi:hypothetical protein